MNRSLKAASGGLIGLLATHVVSAAGIYSEGIGARALSMGGAFVAVADDSTAVFWNPAGLAQLKGRGISVGLCAMSTWMKPS